MQKRPLFGGLGWADLIAVLILSGAGGYLIRQLVLRYHHLEPPDGAMIVLGSMAAYISSSAL